MLECVTAVTIASLQEPGPLKGPMQNINQSPLAGLSKKGADETHELRQALGTLRLSPFDYIYAAAPLYMLPAVAEMAIVLTGDVGTGYAELPLRCLPLLEQEAIEIHRIISLNPESSLIKVMRLPEQAQFLERYAQGRKKRIEDDAENEGAKHALVLGLPILVQSIAWSFSPKGDALREIETVIPRPGSVLHLDFVRGTLRIPGKQPAR